MKKPMLLHSIEKVHITENGFMSADLNNLSRMVVPGGWVYFNNVRSEFVADQSIEIFSSKADLDAHVSGQRQIEERMQHLAPIPPIRTPVQLQYEAEAAERYRVRSDGRTYGSFPGPKRWWQFWR